MALKIGINGFGCIGSVTLRALAESGRDDLTPIAVSDLGSAEANACPFRYDSVHGRFAGEVEIDDTVYDCKIVRNIAWPTAGVAEIKDQLAVRS
jgi:glyceraldehyde 3-phosphate dehydrogenase